jgi:hypothetical protein
VELKAVGHGAIVRLRIELGRSPIYESAPELKEIGAGWIAEYDATSPDVLVP